MKIIEDELCYACKFITVLPDGSAACTMDKCQRCCTTCKNFNPIFERCKIHNFVLKGIYSYCEDWKGDA